jgi:hypothetical protein
MKANEEGNADIEVAIPIAKKTEGAADMKCYVLPGGRKWRGSYKDVPIRTAGRPTISSSHGSLRTGRRSWSQRARSVPE